MAFKSWSIYEFTGASVGSPVTTTLLSSSVDTSIIVISLVLSNYSTTEEANITVSRTDISNTVKFKWKITIPALNSPVSLDSKIAFINGDKLKITSDAVEVGVDASGDES